MAANDWIRLNKGFITKPEVVRTAVALKVDKWRAAGAWITILDWADDLTEDGFIPRLDGDAIDAIVDLPGFFAVACAVGWMAVDADGVRFLNYTRYNTKSAKARSVDAKRQAKKRYRGQNSDENRTELGHNSDETRTKVRATYTETVTSNTTTPTPPTPNAGGGGGGGGVSFAVVKQRAAGLRDVFPFLTDATARRIARLPLEAEDMAALQLEVPKFPANADKAALLYTTAKEYADDRRRGVLDPPASAGRVGDRTAQSASGGAA